MGRLLLLISVRPSSIVGISQPVSKLVVEDERLSSCFVSFQLRIRLKIIGLRSLFSCFKKKKNGCHPPIDVQWRLLRSLPPLLSCLVIIRRMQKLPKSLGILCYCETPLLQVSVAHRTIRMQSSSPMACANDEGRKRMSRLAWRLHRELVLAWGQVLTRFLLISKSKM